MFVTLAETTATVNGDRRQIIGERGVKCRWLFLDTSLRKKRREVA